MFYCKTCGHDGARISDRLRLVGLTAGDRPLARRLHGEVIAPNAQTAADAFYAERARHPDFDRVPGKDYDRNRLKRTLHDYLLALGRAFERPATFDDRPRPGLSIQRRACEVQRPPQSPGPGPKRSQ